MKSPNGNALLSTLDDTLLGLVVLLVLGAYLLHITD